MQLTGSMVTKLLFLQAYKDFEIPTELVYVWRYLRDSYDTDAMQESCPADREIITHYLDKAATKPHIPQVKKLCRRHSAVECVLFL